jgi:N-6 DNA Methylase
MAPSLPETLPPRVGDADPVSDLLQTYLAELRVPLAGGAGTPETALYPALHGLLSEIGARLEPRVFCIQHPSDSGGGQPDFGLFVQSQLRDGVSDRAPPGKPERGVIEAKPIGHRLHDLSRSKQVERYWEHYGLVLCVNFREFLIAGRDQFGRRVDLERFEIAPDEAAFLDLVAHPRKAPPDLGKRFEAFLERALRHAAPIYDPKDLAWFLASYARDALARIEGATGRDDLGYVKESLSLALGLSFEGEKGQHFFRSTLVQTLFYGLFSAWTIWARSEPDREKRKGFSGQSAPYILRSPILRGLFELVHRPGTLGQLSLVPVLDWAAAALRRTDDAVFFQRFSDEHAIQYFYEPFLEAFDPELREQLGVWYTPPELVDFMVGRVEQALVEDLGIADGLADPNVWVLDPCCGTGSYLIAVLKRIEARLRETTDPAFVAGKVKQAACTRIVGFEIMPAPFTIAMLQVAHYVENLGTKFADRPESYRPEEEPAIFLTNALIGWREEASYPHSLMLFPELDSERSRAEEVKRERPILVILGNPPYNGFAGVAEAAPEERELTLAYKTGRRTGSARGQGLNDLYARFWRMAERRIAEIGGRGIVCYVSNYSWVDGLSFPAMRERLVEGFDRVEIDCLNGDSRKTGKKAPDGRSDPSIFSTERNREGIQVGTAVATLIRTRGRDVPLPEIPKEIVPERPPLSEEERLAGIAADENDVWDVDPVTGQPIPGTPDPEIDGVAEKSPDLRSDASSRDPRVSLRSHEDDQKKPSSSGLTRGPRKEASRQRRGKSGRK